MKIKINSKFHAYWGEITPKVGDVLTVVSRGRRGYYVKLDETDTRYLIFYYEADLVFE